MDTLDPIVTDKSSPQRNFKAREKAKLQSQVAQRDIVSTDEFFKRFKAYIEARYRLSTKALIHEENVSRLPELRVKAAIFEELKEIFEGIETSGQTAIERLKALDLDAD